MKRFKKIRVRLHKLAKSVFKVTKLPEMKIITRLMARRIPGKRIAII